MLVYKYLDINGVKNTVENKSVVLKCPTEYKDYFDSMFFIDEKENKKAFDLFINYLLFEDLRLGKLKASTNYTKILKKNAMIAETNIRKTRVFKKQPDLIMAYILALKLLNKKDKDIRNEFNKTMQDTLNKIRETALISCFGSSFDNYYLWSEYAEGHKGICMEYEVDGNEYRKVEYAKEKPSFQLTKVLEIYFGHKVCNKEIDTNDKSFWFALDPIFTKLDIYENEKEIRCVFSKNKKGKNIYEQNGLTLLKMPSPKRIFIGVNTSRELEKLVIDAYPSAHIEKMKISNIKKAKLSS